MQQDSVVATVPRLFALGRPHVARLALAAVCLFVSAAGFLAVPYAIRLLTDSIFVHHDAAALDRLALLLLALVVVTAAFGYGRGYLLAATSGRIVADLREQLYRHMLCLSMSFYDEQRAGDLMSRLTSDTTLVQSVITNDLLSGLRDTVTLVAVIVIVVVLDWRLAMVTLILAPVVAITGTIVGRRTRTLSKRAQEQLGEAGTVLEETLSAMRVVKAFDREGFELMRYSRAVERSYTIGLSASRLQAAFESLMLTAGLGAVSAVLWFGGREVLFGHLTPGGLISFLFYLTMLIGPMQGLGALYGQIQRAAGGASRIFEILDTTPAMVDPPGARPLHVAGARVEFHNVSFQYRDAGSAVLDNVSLIANSGERLAIVGPSGAGKTTLVSLLPRFYEPFAGRITIDGQDTAGVTISSLRSAMALVPQEATLFGGTVRENIAYGRIDATDHQIRIAAERANAAGFVAALPDGYETLVGDRGVKLSGGQRQRIAIARAILRDPSILILDEATSALDNESESLVQEALERLMQGRTTFVIAHRLTTVERADRIVVLDGGRVVEQGTHHELLRLRGLYQRLYTREFDSGLRPV